MLKKLPIEGLIVENPQVLKSLARANRTLGELKGFSETIPNKHLLINAMTLNEAKDSSEIEQIVTTHDELYLAMTTDGVQTPEAKEVLNYRKAIWQGYQFVEEKQFIHTNLLVELHHIVEPDKGSIRKIPGTNIQNAVTGEVIYTPPQAEAEIWAWLRNLEEYINGEYDFDPLIQLAVIHYQFEAIHPFYDGNGRTGRILNVLFLVLKDLLTSPVLYLSKYILKNKAKYYQLLQAIQLGKDDAEVEWIIFIIDGVAETADDTLKVIKRITNAMGKYAADVKNVLPKIYSKELIDALFFEFYTKSVYIEKRLSVSRITAGNYLKQLESEGFLSSEKIGRERIYKNGVLFDIIVSEGS